MPGPGLFISTKQFPSHLSGELGGERLPSVREMAAAGDAPPILSAGPMPSSSMRAW